MESKNFQLETVNERFPMDKDRIVPLYYTDAEFRAICEDYYMCLYFLKKFRQEFSENLGSIEEYEKIRSELENELKERINKGPETEQ